MQEQSVKKIRKFSDESVKHITSQGEMFTDTYGSNYYFDTTIYKRDGETNFFEQVELKDAPAIIKNIFMQLGEIKDKQIQ